MNRILTPDQEALRKEKLVKKFVETIEIVHERFSYRSKYLGRHFIHLKPNGTPFRVLWKVIDYLYKLKQEAGNPIEWLIEDYIQYMYEKNLKMRGDAPFLNYFSPTDNNQIGFEEWISRKEKEIHPDQYWITEKVDLKRLKKKVDRKLEDINKVRKLTKVPEQLDINIIERGEEP